MKKLTIFASMMLALGMTTSCSMSDNAIDPDAEESAYIEHDGEEIKVDVVATFVAEVGSEVTLTLGVYDQYDIYGVDFGDGNVVTDTVCYQNGGLKDENGLSREDTEHKSATSFKGTVTGEGVITVFGNSDVWYLVASGGAVPTSFNQKKLTKVQQVSISGANVEVVELPQLDSLKTFSFNNSPVKTLDVSKAVNLTSLTVNQTSVSKFEPQLESIDLSNNPELTYLSLQGTAAAPGKLKSLDLTSNTKLTGVYVQNNEISELKIGENAITLLNVENNKLNELDLSVLPLLKSLYAASNNLLDVDVTELSALTWLDVKNNHLSTIDLSKNEKLANVYVNNNQLTSLVAPSNVTKQFYFDNNELTFATMPALPAGMNTTSKKKQFHYAPQAVVPVQPEITAEGYVLDLTAQTEAQGLLEEKAQTTFTFVAGETELVEDTDYKVAAPGKFLFLKNLTGVQAVMKNEGYPSLELKTAAFDVKAYE